MNFQPVGLIKLPHDLKEEHNHCESFSGGYAKVSLVNEKIGGVRLQIVTHMKLLMQLGGKVDFH